MTITADQYIVAVIGAGPAGLFAAKELADHGIQVFLFNRDIKPGGLAEYGIYPDKQKLKDGLRKQFEMILDHPLVNYFGNLTVGDNGDIRFGDLRSMGFDAILVTIGAQGTKWLGLPGEDLAGVYHAKDLIYHYNQLPPFSMKQYKIGKKIAIIGVGNVMLDIAHYMIYEQQVESITAIARRGPGEIKFTRKELQYVVNNLDLAHYIHEVERAAPMMHALGQDPQESIDLIKAALEKAEPTHSDSKFRIQFLSATKAILGDENHQVVGLEIEENTLTEVNGAIRSRGTGNISVLDVDTVIFAIGDKVDDSFGLPVNKDEYIKNPAPEFAKDGLSYESYDPETGQGLEGVFLAGWSREASNGLVGLARRDGVNAAHSTLEYLKNKSPEGTKQLDVLRDQIFGIKDQIITGRDLKALAAEERRIALERGLSFFKFSSNEEMLAAMHSQLIVGD